MWLFQVVSKLTKLAGAAAVHLVGRRRGRTAAPHEHLLDLVPSRHARLQRRLPAPIKFAAMPGR